MRYGTPDLVAFAPTDEAVGGSAAAGCHPGDLGCSRWPVVGPFMATRRSRRLGRCRRGAAGESEGGGETPWYRSGAAGQPDSFDRGWVHAAPDGARDDLRGLVSAYQGGNETAATRLFKQSAGLGSPRGMTGLGVLLARRGETKQAEQLYHRADDLGDAKGMTSASRPC